MTEKEYLDKKVGKGNYDEHYYHDFSHLVGMIYDTGNELSYEQYDYAFDVGEFFLKKS